MRPWSYSRLSTIETCPKQYDYYYNQRMPGFRPSSPAADRGTDTHDLAEQYLLGNVPIYPPILQGVATHAMMLKAKKATPELKLAVSDQWEPCEYEDKSAYFRGILDVHYVEDLGDGWERVHIQDWKTGQVYDSHEDQMDTYVALAAPYHPKAKEYVTRLIYIDQGYVSKPKVREAKRVIPIKLMLDGRIKNAEEETIFPVKPGNYCKWCDYSQKYGGPCPYPRQ